MFPRWFVFVIYHLACPVGVSFIVSVEEGPAYVWILARSRDFLGKILSVIQTAFGFEVARARKRVSFGNPLK